MDPAEVRDSNGKAKGEHGFDKRTLALGGGSAGGSTAEEEFLFGQSPAQCQWWDLKKRNADLVFLFKIGKFYEMYNADADIGVREAGLAYMRGDQAHCGFPELA
jgi:DNA mismatch repair protein MSH6